MSESEFPHIFGEAKIGKFTVRNRVKYAACCVSNFNTRDGFVSEREFARDQVIAQTGASIMTNQAPIPISLEKERHITVNSASMTISTFPA